MNIQAKSCQCNRTTSHLLRKLILWFRVER